MAENTARFRPKMYPPPEFPPKKSKMFARTPPAAFPVILGLLGLGLALRRGLAEAGWPEAVADMILGMAVLLWVFAIVAYGVKVFRRPGVVTEDMRVLPGRARPIARAVLRRHARRTRAGPTAPVAGPWSRRANGWPGVRH